MANDIQLIEGETSNAIQFLLTKPDGSPDDLTVYAEVRLVISTFDYSSNVYNIIKTSGEMDTSLFSVGILKWIPSLARPAPLAGFYWLQINREVTGASDPVPVRKYSLETTKRVTV